HSRHFSPIFIFICLFREWQKELKKVKIKTGEYRPSFRKAVFRTFGPQTFFAGFFVFIEECISESHSPLPSLKSYPTSALGDLQCPWTNSMSGQEFWLEQEFSSDATSDSRLCTYLSQGKDSTGQMVNLMSNDVNRFDNSTVFLQYLWVAPLQFMLVMFITTYYAGIEAIAGGSYMGKMFSKLRSMTATKTDIRIQIMNEILDGIKVIKMYAWENPFVQLVMDARNRFILIPVFLLMVILGGEISAQKIFLIFGLFEAIKLPLTHFFPSGISASSEALEFLLLKELTEIQSNINQVILPGRYEPLTVEVSKVSGKWSDESNSFDLKNVSFSVEVGELCAIIGPVGCGKSTVIQALLGEFPISYGEINIKGRISYASQEPWIFSGTVRQNILMGKPLIEKRYREVMRVCALEHDVREWPDGDYTFVGEKGISLSGGQKARINLARCVYTTADIYILDDPLSAVDAHVGKELFNSCIQRFLSEKTVILRLMGQSGFVTYLEATSDEENSDLVSDVLSDAEYIHSKKKEKRQTRSRKSSTSVLVPVPYIGSVSERDSFSEEKGSQEWKVSNKELAIEGRPLPPTYYFAEYQNIDITLGANLTLDLLTPYIVESIYRSLLSVRQLFMSCMRSSQSLHDNMFEKVAFTNSRFFDLNPRRILNRFSKDIGSIDELLPPVLIDTNWVRIFILISITNPIIVIGIAILLLILLIIRRYYLNASRAVKRLEGITRSPVFSQLSSSLDGLATIRSMKIEEMLVEEFDYLQDIHTKEEASVKNVGLSLTLSLALCGMIQWGLRQSAEVENFMTSVERVAEYGDLPKEKGLTSDIKLYPSWPDKGVVEFSKVSMKYDKGTPYVLKDLTFKTTPFEKSSLISAIFRLAEPEGRFLSMASTFDFHHPTGSITLKGSIRKNLDPFNEYGDLDIWHALEQAKLSDNVSGLKAGLESEVSDGGNNFSVGQRQLFCLARAILRKNKVLIMDEATAN
ncbi:ATP-binding cassette sub-family C member 4, partial [Caligus rogercresseyi]